MQSDRSPFPQDYGAYLDGKNNIRIEYLTTLAEKISQAFAYDRLTPSQLRAFYTHAKRAGDAWRRKLLPLESAVREIKKLEAHAQAHEGRRKIPTVFAQFIRKNAQSVSEGDDGLSLRAFLEHFEAVTGFCAGRLRDND